MVTGGAADIVEVLTRYAEAGLEHVCLTPQCHSADEWRAHVRELAEVVRALG